MDGRLTAKVHEVLRPRDSGLDFSNGSDIWQASQQQRCRDSCQISELYSHHNIQSHGFEPSRDLVIKKTSYRSEAHVVSFLQYLTYWNMNKTTAILLMTFGINAFSWIFFFLIMLNTAICCLNFKHIETSIKWEPYCRHFQMHFLAWKLSQFDLNFTEVCQFIYIHLYLVIQLTESSLLQMMCSC